MVDFMQVSSRSLKKDVVEIYPKFIVRKSSDLMIRGGDFYAIWVEEKGLWSTDEQDVIAIVDKELDRFVEDNKKRFSKIETVIIKHMWDAETGTIDSWHKYCQKQTRDNFQILDEKIIFSNDSTNKKDYASKRLSYPLEDGPIPSYEKLISTLYSEEERRKIEWAIGAIVSGDSKHIQKFIVLYGAAGTGKSTILNIVQQLFEGYYSVFDAKALGSSSNSFALEAFKTNPLVAIQHDGDLSKIEDNTRLNSLVSHEMMTVNEKFKSVYSNRFISFLFMGTNKPVKITDGKSGLLRRLIDVSPSGKKLNFKEYKSTTKQIAFELGGIAKHCLDVYLSDPGMYDNYVPTEMMGASNDFYNFIIDSFSVFKRDDSTTLKASWEMYKTYCDDAKVPYPFSLRNFKEELKNYFWDFTEEFGIDDGSVSRSYYERFRTDIFDIKDPREKKSESTETSSNLIEFNCSESIFDKACSDCPAQYATSDETPYMKWADISSVLSDIDTSKLHYVRPPKNHIVIDFDITDETGKKNLARNIEEASKWPATYAEFSKSGAAIHLHYIYSGDVTKLSNIYDDHIEIKIFTGNSSLRRKLTKCNNLPIATISSGLPLKGDDKMIDFDGLKNEKAIRTIIKKNLNKEYHADTRSSIDFITKTLDDAYTSGISYDVSDMENAVFAFAANSTNQADYCIKAIGSMKFKSEETGESVDSDEAPIVFFDCEVFPNLLLVNWKIEGEGNPVVRMINPKSSEIEELLQYKLVGFNNRRYDNHILYARLIGYTEEQIYDLSSKIVNSKKGENRHCFFGEAYNLSYTDIHDFSAKKQSLKKWEIELGIKHHELGLLWDQPVPEEDWIKVAEYCDDDVYATEALFHHLKGDFTARQILADLAGMTINDTTNTLTTRIIFGREKHPALVYTDLSETFPGYEYKDGKNLYRDTDMGLGGYILSNPGIYGNVALLDVASLHPNSIRAMNCFGEYTKKFTDIIDARVAIKHKDLDSARKMLGGKLAPYLEDESTAKDLAQALKIAINSVYGLTAANFDNPFRDIRNKNNIVALRGALFMRTLQDEVVHRGFQIVAIKTDSIKIADATKELVDFCVNFATQYGYAFEHEATYDRMCQLNDADYIARYKDSDWCEETYGYVPDDNKKEGGKWTSTGAMFQQPYVFKKLFSKENVVFDDLCEAKEVKSALYLDTNENLPDGEHDYRFIGKVGLFCPIKPGCGGAELLRKATDKEGNVKYDSVTGTKGYRWMESDMVRELGKEDDIDLSYYDNLVNAAVYGKGTGKTRKPGISDFGDFEWFASDDPYIPDKVAPWTAPDNESVDVPWFPACGNKEIGSCLNCPKLTNDEYHFDCQDGYDVSDLDQPIYDDAFSKH